MLALRTLAIALSVAFYCVHGKSCHCTGDGNEILCGWWWTAEWRHCAPWEECYRHKSYDVPYGLWGGLCRVKENTCLAWLFEHDGYNENGSHKAYHVGSYSQVWKNDAVSSIKVIGHGCKATIWEHANYEGWHVDLDEGQYTNYGLKTRGYKNDAVSSIKVYRTRRRSEEPMESGLAGLNQVQPGDEEPKESRLAGLN